MEIQVKEREAEREEIRKGVGAPRKRKLLVVSDTTMKSEPITIGVRDHGRLVIPEYQRSEFKSWISDLRDAIKRGSMPPPIDVVSRIWEKNDKLYVVDGQQRMWAHIDLDLPIRAKLHKVDTIEDEKSLFLVLNQHRRLSASTFLSAHPGPTTELLNEVNEDAAHPLYNRILINATYNGSHQRIQPATVAVALSTALSVEASGIVDVLAAVDAALGSRKEVASSFLIDLGESFNGKPNAEILQTYGSFWKKNQPLTKGTKSRIRRLRLENVTGTTRADRKAAIERRLESTLQ